MEKQSCWTLELGGLHTCGASDDHAHRLNQPSPHILGRPPTWQRGSPALCTIQSKLCNKPVSTSSPCVSDSGEPSKGDLGGGWKQRRWRVASSFATTEDEKYAPYLQLMKQCKGCRQRTDVTMSLSKGYAAFLCLVFLLSFFLCSLFSFSFFICVGAPQASFTLIDFKPERHQWLRLYTGLRGMTSVSVPFAGTLQRPRKYVLPSRLKEL